MVANQLSYDAWFRREVEKGLASLDRGEFGKVWTSAHHVQQLHVVASRSERSRKSFDMLSLPAL